MKRQEVESWGTDRTIKRLIVKTGDRRSIVDVKDIDYIEASGNYADAYAAGRSYLVRDTMKNLESRLPSTMFLRISRSTIVNMQRITELEKVTSEKYSVLLKCGNRLTMTRNLGEIQEALKYS